jgi:hypothetical protein
MTAAHVHRHRPSLPLRFELAIVLAMFVLVNIVSAYSQVQIGVNDGQGWDGTWYVTVAQEISSGHPLIAEAPFVYRVGTPFLAALVDRDNLIVGFKIVNLAANLTLTLLLTVWLRIFVRDWRVRLGLILAFLFQWHGPIRFVHFYPVAADNWFAALLLAGLLAVHSLEKRTSWLTIAAISALAVLGTLVRESGLLLALIVPLAQNPFKLPPRFPRISPWLFVPLVLAVAAFLGVHHAAEITNAPSQPEAGGLIVPKSIPTYALGWWTAFGPLLVLPLFTWRRAASFLWNHQYMLGLLLIVSLLSSFASPALQLQLQDTERYLFWAMPVVYVLIGRSLEHLLPIMSRPLLALLIVGQVLAERVFWTIPQPGANDPSNVFSHGSSAILLFTPLGGNVEYFDIFPSWMSQGYRLVLLGEYVALAVVIIAWLYLLANHRRSNLSTGVAR